MKKTQTEMVGTSYDQDASGLESSTWGKQVKGQQTTGDMEYTAGGRYIHDMNARGERECIQPRKNLGLW